MINVVIQASDSIKEDVRREENNLFAMMALPAAFIELRGKHADCDPQPVFTLAVREVVRAQEQRIDNAREDEVVALFLKHEGLVGLAKLLGLNASALKGLLL